MMYQCWKCRGVAAGKASDYVICPCGGSFKEVDKPLPPWPLWKKILIKLL